MSKRNNIVFKGLCIITWIIFIGLCIEAGALMVNFIFSILNPEFVANLYQKLDLSAMYNRSKEVFYGMYSFIIVIAILKAYLFYLLALLVSKINLLKPFSEYVARQITKISYFTFSIGLISYIGQQIANNLIQYGYTINNLSPFWVDSEAFVLMAAVVYVIATIFSTGVELQTQKDQTV